MAPARRTSSRARKSAKKREGMRRLKTRSRQYAPERRCTCSATPVAAIPGERLATRAGGMVVLANELTSPGPLSSILVRDASGRPQETDPGGVKQIQKPVVQ